MLKVQVIDKLPLSLSSDPNIHLDENTDYYGLSNVVCALHSLCVLAVRGQDSSTREARVSCSAPFAQTNMRVPFGQARTSSTARRPA
jgi:hypothetical protein